jgi:L-fuconolactonase
MLDELKNDFMIIDSHHHFWIYNPVEYDWIEDNMQRIRTDFLPQDLEEEIDIAGVAGVITVQARQTTEETDWILQLAAENEFIKGVIGWIPLIDMNCEEYLRKYKVNPYLKGVRHILQGEPDPEYMLQNDFNRGIRLLRKYNLVYDILIFDHQLPQTIEFVDAHPDQPFILDHIAKPGIKHNLINSWKNDIFKLAKRENVFCKISGMVTESDYSNWTVEQLFPYFETVLEAFGSERLMFGSDWPVCLVACEYIQWLDIVKDFISKLNAGEQEDILGLNAARIYHLV